MPLVTLHGGPGWPHDSLEPLGEFADERPVVSYDQLGCGKSDSPDDASLWIIERFVEELEQVRSALGYETTSLPIPIGMWGASELSVTGNLKTYERTDRLGEIAIPVLLTCGRYDEASPETTAGYQKLIPGAQMAVFENSAHVPHFEEKSDPSQREVACYFVVTRRFSCSR